MTTVTAAASIGGETWTVKGKPDCPKNVIFAVETNRERVTMDFPGRDKRSAFEPNRVEMQRRDGAVVAKYFVSNPDTVPVRYTPSEGDSHDVCTGSPRH